MAVKGFAYDSGKVLQTFRRLGRRVQSVTPILRLVGEFVAQTAKSSFNKQADPETGAGWKRLAPATQAFKAANGYSAAALVRSRQLKNSIAYSITGMTVFTGPAAHHGKYHQLGAPRAGIPARPFMGLSTGDKTYMNRMIQDWVSLYWQRCC